MHSFQEGCRRATVEENTAAAFVFSQGKKRKNRRPNDAATRSALSLKRLEKHALSQFRCAQIGFPESSVAKIAVPVGGPRAKWPLSKRGKKRPQTQGFEPEPVEPKFYPSKFSATRLSAPNQKRLEKKPRS
jgi:hypothetical protein